MSDAITHNPNTGEELARYPQMSDEQMQAAIDRCHEAFEQWKLVSLEDRADIIRKIGEGLAANQDQAPSDRCQRVPYTRTRSFQGLDHGSCL